MAPAARIYKVREAGPADTLDFVPIHVEVWFTDENFMLHKRVEWNWEPGTPLWIIWGEDYPENGNFYRLSRVFDTANRVELACTLQQAVWTPLHIHGIMAGRLAQTLAERRAVDVQEAAEIAHLAATNGVHTI